MTGIGAAVGAVLLQVERSLVKCIVVRTGRRQWQVRARMWVEKALSKKVKKPLSAVSAVLLQVEPAWMWYAHGLSIVIFENWTTTMASAGTDVHQSLWSFF
jgi:hypothetical protein